MTGGFDFVREHFLLILVEFLLDLPGQVVIEDQVVKDELTSGLLTGPLCVS